MSDFVKTRHWMVFLFCFVWNVLTGYVDAVKDYLDLESRAPSPTSVSLPHSVAPSYLVHQDDDEKNPPTKKHCADHQHKDNEWKTSKETHHFFFYFDDNMTHLNRFSFGKILDKKKRNVSCGGGVGCFTTVFFDIPFSSDDVISPLIAVANWAPS